MKTSSITTKVYCRLMICQDHIDIIEAENEPAADDDDNISLSEMRKEIV